MIEAYKIGGTLNFNGNAFEKMLEFAKSTKAATKAMNELIAPIKAINTQMELLDKRLISLNPFLKSTVVEMRALKGALTPLNTSFTGLNTKLSSSLNRMELLTPRTRLLKEQMEGLAVSSAAAKESMKGLGAGAIGGGGHRRGHHGASNLYHAGHGVAGVGTAASIGVGARMAGGFGLAAAGVAYLGYHGYKEAREYDREKMKFAQQGFSDTEIANADKIARTTKLRGVSQLDMLAAVTDAGMATKNFHDLSILAPLLAKATAGNVAIGGNFSHKDSQDLIKFAEIAGGSSAAGKASALDTGEMVISASGMRIKPADLLNFQRMAGTAATHFSRQGYLQAEPIIQELGGHQAGTAWQTGYRQLVAGQMSTTQAKSLTKFGILDKNAVNYDDFGRKLSSKYDGLRQDLFKLLGSRPADFTRAIVDIYKNQGITKPEQINQMFSYQFGRTFAKELSAYYKNDATIRRAEAMGPKAFGIESTYQKGLQTSAGKELRLKKSYEDFSKAIGELDTPLINKSMDILSGIFEKLTSITKNINDLFSSKFMDSLRETFPSKKEGQGWLNYLKTPVGDLSKNMSASLSNKPTGQMVQVHSTVEIDKNAIGHAVTHHQTMAASKPPTGSTQHNPYDAHALNYSIYSGVMY